MRKRDVRDGTYHYRGWLVEAIYENAKVKTYGLVRPGWESVNFPEIVGIAHSLREAKEYIKNAKQPA